MPNFAPPHKPGPRPKGGTLRFVAASLPRQARRGPRAPLSRNAVARRPICQGRGITPQVNRLTVDSGKSRDPPRLGYGAGQTTGEGVMTDSIAPAPGAMLSVMTPSPVV